MVGGITRASRGNPQIRWKRDAVALNLAPERCREVRGLEEGPVATVMPIDRSDGVRWVGRTLRSPAGGG